MATYYRHSRIFRRTATGERFNDNEMTAAQSTLPLGTRVRVTNLDNGRSVVVRINDRPGPTNHDAIDLARGAAARLGMLYRGVVDVQVAVVPDDTPIEVAEVPEYLDPPIRPRHLIRSRTVIGKSSSSPSLQY